MNTNDATKYYPDFESLREASSIMNEFQILRNILRKDYETLLELTKKNIDNQCVFNAMYRACLVQLFTTIEADLYGIGLLDPDIKDNKRNFYSTFTKTFTQAAKTWSKEDIYDKYFQTHFEKLMQIKNERNDLTHPKKIEKLILPNMDSLKHLKNAFQNYTSFINEFMNGFFIACKNTITPEQFELLNKEIKDRGIILNEIQIKHTIVFH